MLLTLPQLADAVGVEYRTLHAWVQRGLIHPSVQRSRGTGVPNLFSERDAVRTKTIFDLRQAGLSLERLADAAAGLDEHEEALTTGAILLVNGSISVVSDPARAADAIAHESLTLVYNTAYAIAAVRASLANESN